MEVPEKVPCGDVSHDVFNGSKRPLYVGGIVHSKEDSSNELESKEQPCERAKTSAIVKVIGGGVV